MNLQKITEEIKREVRNGADANTEPEVHGFDYLYRKETIDRLVDNVALRAYKQALLDVRDECVVKRDDFIHPQPCICPICEGSAGVNSARATTLANIERLISEVEKGV